MHKIPKDYYVLPAFFEPMPLDIASSLPIVGGWGVVGFAFGFVVKKILKYLLIFVGIYVASLLYLQHAGWITFNGSPEGLVDGFAGFLTREGAKVWAAVGASLPLMGAFGVGASLGFAQG